MPLLANHILVQQPDFRLRWVSCKIKKKINDGVCKASIAQTRILAFSLFHDLPCVREDHEKFSININYPNVLAKSYKSYLMQIGSYTLKNKLIVAPMAGVTDRPFRQLCKRMGAAMAVSEMVSSNSLLWGSEKTRRRASHEGEVEPISVQIAGADPDMMAKAARYNADQGAEIIDINMGCPAKKICNVMAGSALLKDEVLVGKILDAVVKAVNIPVTLKIRTGWDIQNKNAVNVARIAENVGIQALAIHGRTRACAYQGQAEYETIAAVKNMIKIPVIANGDINSPEKVKAVLEYTQADAVMIGRAAQGRPWIFREINHFLATGKRLPSPEVAEIHRILIDHLHELYSFYGEYSGVRIARKHISWYTRGLAGSAAFRHAMNRLPTPQEQLSATNAFFGELAEKGCTLAYVEDEAVAI